MNFRVFQCPKCGARGRTRPEKDSDGNEITVCKECETRYTSDEFKANFHLDGEHPPQQPKAPTAPPPPPSPPTIPAPAVGTPTEDSFHANGKKFHFVPPPEGVEVCSHCRVPVRKLNPHRMDKSKIGLMLQMRWLHEQGHEWILIQERPHLIQPGERARTIHVPRRTIGVYIIRLSWFGLVTKRDPAAKRSEWAITKAGYGFLDGDHLVPEEILCRDGLRIAQTHAQVTIRDVEGVILDREYWTNYWKLQAPDPRKK